MVTLNPYIIKKNPFQTKATEGIKIGSEKRKKSDNSVVVLIIKKKTNLEASKLDLRKTIRAQFCLRVQWRVDLKDSEKERDWPSGQLTTEITETTESYFSDLRSS